MHIHSSLEIASPSLPPAWLTVWLGIQIKGVFEVTEEIWEESTF